MNKQLVELYILPMLRTLIDKYLNQFVGTGMYDSRAEALYNFYEYIRQEVQRD